MAPFNQQDRRPRKTQADYDKEHTAVKALMGVLTSPKAMSAGVVMVREWLPTIMEKVGKANSVTLTEGGVRSAAMVFALGLGEQYVSVAQLFYPGEESIIAKLVELGSRAGYRPQVGRFQWHPMPLRQSEDNLQDAVRRVITQEEWAALDAHYAAKKAAAVVKEVSTIDDLFSTGPTVGFLEGIVRRCKPAAKKDTTAPTTAGAAAPGNGGLDLDDLLASMTAKPAAVPAATTPTAPATTTPAAPTDLSWLEEGVIGQTAADPAVAKAEFVTGKPAGKITRTDMIKAVSDGTMEMNTAKAAVTALGL